MDPVLLTQLLPDGHPPHDADQDGRTGHGEDEEEAEQDGDGSVGPGRDQAGDEDDDHDAEAVHQQPGDGHRTSLQDPTDEGLV